MNKKLFVILLTSIFLVIGLMACSNDLEQDASQSAEQKQGNANEDSSQSESKESKEINIAFDAIPPTIDPHLSTAEATTELSRPIFEGLVALDSEYMPQPMLAESWNINEDGTEYTFHLREGILFHNGKELIAEDVVASLERWRELSVLGRGNFGNASITALDDYTVMLTLPEPNAIAVVTLANPTQSAAIMPKEVIENAGADGVSEYIGTGPYKLEEYVEDQSLRYVKFEDYQPVSGPANGLSGKKEAIIDTINIEIVTDPSTRIAGIQTGQYDLALRLNIDDYEMLENDEDIENYAKDHLFATMIINQKDGVLTDQKMRQAILAALDLDAISKAAFGNENFYTINHSLAVESQVAWYNDSGKDLYNAKDYERAKSLLAEANYNGEEIVILVSRAYEHHYKAAIAAEQQLKEIGINIKLEVYDWSTLLEVRNDPTIWDIFITHWPAEANPSNFVFLYSKNEYPGWIENNLMDSLIDGIKVAKSTDEASKLFAELQAEYYDYVPSIKYAEFSQYHASRDYVKGFDAFYGIILWNVDIEK